MPKALVITRNLPPLVGGMERLIWHIVDELRKEYHVHVIGPAECGVSLPNGVSSSETPIRPIYRYLFHTALLSLKQALIRRPHVVFAGSGLTAPFAWLVARISGARCLVYLHGLDVEANNFFYRMLWLPLIRRFDRILVNSRFTRKLAMKAGIDNERMEILHPGVELADLNEAELQRADFRDRHNLGETPVMLFVGRITARKGLAVFVRDILPSIIKQQPEAKLVVIGDEAKSALLRASGERERIEKILTLNGLGEHVIILGECPQDDPELNAAYFGADVLVFPIQQRLNDNEGFGMVAIEAAAHNLPTVAFSVGGIGDAVADNVSGKLVPAGDNQAFARAVISKLKHKTSLCSDEVYFFASKFAWPLFGEKLRHLC